MIENLITAIDNNDLKTIKEIIIHNPEIVKEKWISKFNNTYSVIKYVYIYSSKYLEIINFLLDFSIDKNETLKILISKFRMIMSKNYTKPNELNDLIELIELTIEKGANVNCTEGHQGDGILHILLKYDSNEHSIFSGSEYPTFKHPIIKLLRILIKNGVRINRKNYYGEYCIQSILNNIRHYKGNMYIIMEIMKLMIDNGLEINLNPNEINERNFNIPIFKTLFQRKLWKMLNEKDREIERLKKENEELRFAPGNAGYFEAMENFNNLARKEIKY